MTKQPAPRLGTGIGIHDELLVRMLPGSLAVALRQRKAIGLETYGVPLQRNNGRDAMQDLREEIADAIAYAQQANQDALVDDLIALWAKHRL